MLINEILGIKYPIIQGAMTSISDGRFAAEVSKAGGLGIIASGTWDKERVRKEIHIAKSITSNSIGVNIYMMSPYVNDIISLVIEEKIGICTTGAQSPEMYIKRLVDANVKVFPVVSSVTLAKRMVRYGISGIIAEGMESGGHIGDETTMALIPQMVKELDIPVIAAGGIASGSQLAACLAMGACGIQIGTRLLASSECMIHKNYKDAIVNARDNSTLVILKSRGTPIRVYKNRLSKKYVTLEKNNELLDDVIKEGEESLEKGLFSGDVDWAALPMGQIAGFISDIKPIKEIFDDIIKESLVAFDSLNDNINKLKEID